jgi:hypothetical protein
VSAGVDVVRINFSHGTADDHRKRVDALRPPRMKAGRTVGVMADLQGPKIRIGKFADGPVQIKAGQEFILDAACTLGDEGRVGLDYPDLVNDVRKPATCCCSTTVAPCSTCCRSRQGDPSAATATTASCRTTRASTSRAAASRRRP